MRRGLLAFGVLFPLAVLAQEDLSGEPAPAGDYRLDPAPARLPVRVNHLGFSQYTALILTFDAALAFDPDRPDRMSVTATADPASIETHDPDPSYDFNGLLTEPDFLDVARFPDASLTSTQVGRTGERTVEVTGDLTLHGVTRPLTLAVTFNGGYGGHPQDAGARIGISARGTFKRSDFGIGFGLPPPGSTMEFSTRWS